MFLYLPDTARALPARSCIDVAESTQALSVLLVACVPAELPFPGSFFMVDVLGVVYLSVCLSVCLSAFQFGCPGA
jgi:hypothetical protein